MPDRTIADFELRDHGIEHEQYFQGCGTALTGYEDCATGCGDNPREAVDDALECLAQIGWDTEGMEARIRADCWPCCRTIPTRPCVPASAEDSHYYVSILVR